jgi:hypothetical protein
MSRLKVSIRGTASSYECEDLDAGLPMHAHQPGSQMEHDVHCTAGSLIVYVHPNEHHILHAGETLNFDATRWHGLVPLEIGTKFTNTSNLIQDDFDSVLESPHNAPDWVLELRK